MTATGRKYAFAEVESSYSAAYSLNVSNLLNTGHSVGATPPAAMAEHRTCCALVKTTDVGLARALKLASAKHRITHSR